MKCVVFIMMDERLCILMWRLCPSSLLVVTPKLITGQADFDWSNGSFLVD